MKRLFLLGLVALAAVAGALVSIGAGDGERSGDRYRVDALFQTAANLIPGQEVKIAGANVGTVEDVTVTPDYRARVQMSVDERFAPFRADATCNVQPQSLIGERFVQCEPGTPDGGELRGRGGHAPTVPLARTTSPVDLDLILSAFRLPTRERLALVLNEVGMGFAARGGDLNEAIRRANPALQQTRRALQVVNRQRRALQDLIDGSDTVLAQLGPQRRQVQDTIRRAADLTDVTAANRDDLSETIRRLPPLLARARPALADVKGLSDSGTPLLRDLRAASPQLQRLVSDLEPFSDAARPTIDRLGETSRTGLRTVRDARPVVKRLETFAREAKPTGRLVDELFASMRQRGAVEGLQSFVYNAALAQARFDRNGHLLPAYPVAPTGCLVYATRALKRCEAHPSDQVPAAQVDPNAAARRGTATAGSRDRARSLLDVLLR